MKINKKVIFYSLALSTSMLFLNGLAFGQKEDKLDGPEIVIPTSPVLTEGRKIEMLPKLTRDSKITKF